jgi:hypothetical protein
MDFKRLNNMTGMDPVLNRRITSIFISEFEDMNVALKNLPLAETADSFMAALHKIRPGMIIFERDELINKFERLISRKQGGETITKSDQKLEDAVNDAAKSLGQLKDFLKKLS